jgi:hypothetical protein
MEPKILCEGAFYPKDIALDFSGLHERKIDIDIDRKIKETWVKYKDDKTKSGGMIWDANTYRLNFLKQTGNKIQLFVGEIPFSVRIGSREHLEELFRLGQDFFPNGLFLTSFIQTSDGNYLMGHMSGKTTSLSRTGLIGGVLSKDEKEIKTPEDIFEGMLKEIKEEINIQREDVTDIYLRSVIQTEKMQACLLFSIKTSLNDQNIRDNFTSNEEIIDILILNKEQLIESLNALMGYKKIISTLI